MSISLSKSFLHRKFTDLILKDYEKFDSTLFDAFLDFINVDNNKSMTDEFQLAHSENLNKEKFIELIKTRGFTIFGEEWNVYDSINEFLKIKPKRNISALEYKKFCGKVIAFNAIAIIDNNFNKAEYDIQTLDKELGEILDFALFRFNHLEIDIIKFILLKSHEAIDYISQNIFDSNYLVLHNESEQIKIIENTSTYIFNSIEPENIKLNSNMISILEEEFNVKNLEEKILEKFHTNESSKVYNDITMTISSNLSKFKNIVEFDIVAINDSGMKYLETLSKVLLENHIRVCFIDVLKSFKSNKNDRVKKVLEDYRLNTKDECLKYLEELVDLNSKGKISSLIDIYYKEFKLENFKDDITKNHNYMAVHTSSLEKNEQCVSDKLAAREKNISYKTNIFQN